MDCLSLSRQAMDDEPCLEVRAAYERNNNCIDKGTSGADKG